MIDLLNHNQNMHQIARIMLLQSGPLLEFGELEQVDQIVIESFELDIDKIIITASYGKQRKQFVLKTERFHACPHNG